MIPITTHSLEKLESLFKDLGYRVRYEKGNFKTAACILQNSRVIVVNKFSNLEVKIQSLYDLIQEISGDEGSLNDKQKIFYRNIKQTKLSI